MPNLSANLSAIWDTPVASTAPPRSDYRNQSIDFASDSSPKSMSSFFASVQPTPIGWHLNNNNTKSTPCNQFKTYGPLTNNNHLTLTSGGDNHVDDMTSQSFTDRYQQLKEIEGYKNNLIEVSRVTTY